jgi:hypothetical protein
MTDAIPPRPRPLRRRHPSRRRHAARTLGATAAVAGLIAAGWASWVDDEPVAPPAAPVLETTRLQLLVADAPAPFVVDVDSGVTTPITGLPTAHKRIVWLVPVGHDALIASARIDRFGPAQLYLLRQGSTAATPFGRALTAVASHDGKGTWLMKRRRPQGCMLREVDLLGRDRQPPFLASCNTGLVADLPGGLLINYVGPLGADARTELIRRGRPDIEYGDWQAQPLVGNLVLSGTDTLTGLVLHDMRTRVTRRLSWPSGPAFGVAQTVGEPHGTRAIVEFARYSPRHLLDLWLLDTRTRRWAHLPDMPTRLVPKKTSVQWTDDGRVVLLNGRTLGLWRPGDAHVQLRSVRPSRQPGSSFLVWG